MLDSSHGRGHPGSCNDVVIVGGGLAGLFCALRLAPRPVTVLSAAGLGEGASSAWAQGGIAAAMSTGDSVDRHLADTVAAGCGIVDEKIARLMVADAPGRVLDLLDFGVPFDRTLAGELAASREAAHSHSRIVHVAGDRAGAAIMGALSTAVTRTPTIEFVADRIAEDIAVEGGRVAGVVARPREGGAAVLYPARALVIATGGIGHLYAVTTNPPEANGDGVGIAARAGAVIADPEFVQFHPTAIDVGADPAPLATEALRGEGAVLVNDAGARFMEPLHADADLAPRDIVARALHREIEAGRRVFLDCTTAVGAAFPDRFPTVFRSCEAAGIDPRVEPIPVAPAEHYHMGGIFTDAAGRSTLDGLWACGEAASTGVHGANRLASNSLLEAVAFAARIADDIGRRFPLAERGSLVARPDDDAGCRPAPADVADLRRAMARHAGVERDATGLAAAMAEIERLAAGSTSRRLDNMLATARLIVAGAAARQESRGGHFRRDYPEARPAWRRRTFLSLADTVRGPVPA